MRRFDDFTKLLLGLLVAQIVREHHLISKNLVGMFLGTSDYVAECFTYALLLLFLRNTHASINWDQIAGDGKFTTVMDCSIYGRFFVFLVTLTSLVIVPLVVLDTLTGHTTSSPGGTILMLFLFVPFFLYFLWDSVLFFASETKNSGRDHERVVKVVRNWLLVDALALLALVILLFRYSYITFTDTASQYLYFVEAFMFLAVATVVIDYLMNREFYFGKQPESLARYTSSNGGVSQ